MSHHPGTDRRCWQTCRAVETEAAAATAQGVRVVALRLGTVLSAAGGALAPTARLFSLGLGGRVGPGTQYMSWITRADAVRAIEHVIATPAIVGAVNVVAPAPVTNAEFTGAVQVVALVVVAVCVLLRLLLTVVRALVHAVLAADALAAALHRPARLHKSAALVSRLAGEAARESLLCSQRAVPAALVKSGFTFVHGTLRSGVAAALQDDR